MKEPVIIEWHYEPCDFFEEKIEFVEEFYSYDIDDGKVTLRINSEHFENDQNIKEKIDTEVKGRFLGAQVLNHKKFTLKNKSFARLLPEGKRAINVVVDCFVSISAMSADVVITDADGNITHDSKAERLLTTKEISELSAKYYSIDKTAKAILSSYKAAVDDPENELVHLYEIRESLGSYFRNTAILLKSLNVTQKEWRNFGRLANNVPLLEGRHRGQKPGELRASTPEELKDAREFSKKLISSYLKQLEDKKK